MNIIQYGKTGQPIRVYNMIGAFPTSVEAIELNWENQSQIETFQVTFAYDYWLPDGTTELTNAYADLAADPAAS
jgi:hypothetical protein